MTKEELVRRDAIRELISVELKGKNNFRRRTEYLTEELVNCQMAATSAKERVATIEPELTEYQNLEHAICPENHTFKSYFDLLEEQIAELQAVRRDLLKLADIQTRTNHDKIKELTLENEALRRRAEACEESKTKSATPPQSKTIPEPSKAETKQEAESKTKETESSTPPPTPEPTAEELSQIQEQWDKFNAEHAEEGEETESSEVPMTTDEVKALLTVILESAPPSVKETAPIDLQALLDEALKG